MSRVWATLALFSLVSVARTAAAHLEPADPSGSTPRPTLVAAHPTLKASVGRIAQGSTAFRLALEQLTATGRRILILTPGQMRSLDLGEYAAAADASLLAETTPLLDAELQVRAAVVVVNLGLLEQAHAANGSLMAELQTDLDRILIHEIYGHALPYLQAGDLSGRCSDPKPGQRPSDACSIRRENEVRAELGIGKRIDSGLESLTLSRRMR